MTARATWKGVLQISRVTIPIKVFPATESSESLSFNQLHAACQTRLSQKKWCVTCAREVPSAEIVKGFEFQPGRYVLLLPEELDAVQPPSTKCITLVQFADEVALDSLYVDRTYYLAPDGTGEAYGVVSEAMHGKVGIGKLALYGREYLVAVVARGIASPKRAILLMHTLHHAAEIRSADDLDFGLPGTAAVVSIRLARQVIEAYPQRLNLATFTDAYQVDLRRLIDAKVAGQEIVESVPLTPTPVLPLAEALMQSLAAVGATPRSQIDWGPPAKAKRKRA
jgi:DNA end-binding protein Ku